MMVEVHGVLLYIFPEAFLSKPWDRREALHL
jgi:hypothetical protein